jgi:hypothetical protein
LDLPKERTRIDTQVRGLFNIDPPWTTVLVKHISDSSTAVFDRKWSYMEIREINYITGLEGDHVEWISSRTSCFASERNDAFNPFGTMDCKWAIPVP